MHVPAPKTAPSPPPECPMHVPGGDSSTLSSLNNMPNLSQSPSANQRSLLPTQRETSSIPRSLSSTDDLTISATATKWVYPSAQQFYNALVRKGWETPEEDVESMVFIHNHLNEVAWREVLEWERRSQPGAEDEAELLRFKGRPGEISPKAQAYLWLGWLMPNTYR